MKLQIYNASKATDSRIFSLIRFAASFFPTVTGRVTVEFSETKKPKGLFKNPDTADGLPWIEKPDLRRQKLLAGRCFYTRQIIAVRSTLNETHHQFPLETKTLRYFASSQIPINHYTLHNPDEVILHVAAHEFAHCLPRGQRFRKSRIETFCENRATEVLEASRTPEGQAWIAKERARIQAPPAEQPPVDESEQRRAVLEKKLANIAAKLKRWNTKAKRAATAIKKLTRQQRRLLRAPHHD